MRERYGRLHDALLMSIALDFGCLHAEMSVSVGIRWQLRTARIMTQVFAGNRERTVMAWEPPKEALEETVLLNGHTGWVRALATCGQWLFSASCSTISQWDMSRAVPRHKSDVKLNKGDITTLTTGNNSVYACSADGSIQCALLAPPPPSALNPLPALRLIQVGTLYV